MFHALPTQPPLWQGEGAISTLPTLSLEYPAIAHKRVQRACFCLWGIRHRNGFTFVGFFPHVLWEIKTCPTIASIP